MTFSLLNCIRSRVVRNQVVLVLVQVNAIEGVIIRLGAVAIDIGDTRVIRVALDCVVTRRAAGLRAYRPNHKKCGSGEITPIQRDGRNLVGTERDTEAGVSCV